MGKRGIVLILSFTVILVLSILATAIVAKSVSESRIAQRYARSVQAFWLAEAGISYAAKRLNTEPNWTGTDDSPVPLGNGTYSVIVEPVPDYPLRWQITSTGLVGNSQRIIRVIVGMPWGRLNYAIETTGDLSIKGSVDLNPDGSSATQSTLDFEEIFGVGKDTIKAGADHLYNNPPNNQQPVDGITWVDLTGDTPQTTATYTISSNWSGSGLLVIDGHRNSSTEDIPALEISGNWTFSGMIWVIGKIKITGTPVITGGVFAESAVDVDSTLAGNATINYNGGDIESAFGLLSGTPKVTLLSWQEL